jgi:hypothetical protein
MPSSGIVRVREGMGGRAAARGDETGYSRARAAAGHTAARRRTADVSFRRVAEFASGWTAGGMPPDAVSGLAEKARSAWSAAGREGQPRIVALAYFGLGDTEEASRQALLHY